MFTPQIDKYENKQNHTDKYVVFFIRYTCSMRNYEIPTIQNTWTLMNYSLIATPGVGGESLTCAGCIARKHPGGLGQKQFSPAISGIPVPLILNPSARSLPLHFPMLLCLCPKSSCKTCLFVHLVHFATPGTLWSRKLSLCPVLCEFYNKVETQITSNVKSNPSTSQHSKHSYCHAPYEKHPCS